MPMLRYFSYADEVEHDSENYQGGGLCYLQKPKAEVNNKKSLITLCYSFLFLLFCIFLTYAIFALS